MAVRTLQDLRDAFASWQASHPNENIASYRPPNWWRNLSDAPAQYAGTSFSPYDQFGNIIPQTAVGAGNLARRLYGATPPIPAGGIPDYTATSTGISGGISIPSGYDLLSGAPQTLSVDPSLLANVPDWMRTPGYHIDGRDVSEEEYNRYILGLPPATTTGTPTTTTPPAPTTTTPTPTTTAPPASTVAANVYNPIASPNNPYINASPTGPLTPLTNFPKRGMAMNYGSVPNYTDALTRRRNYASNLA